MRKSLTIITVLLFVTGSIFAQQGNQRRGFNGQGNGYGYNQGQGYNQGNGYGYNQGQNVRTYRFLNIPNLTEIQTTQIQKLQANNMKEMLPLRNLLREKQAHRNTLITGDNVNMVEVNNLLDEIGQIKIKMAKTRAIQRQNVRNLLTDDQKVFFDTYSRNGNRYGNQRNGNRNRY